MYLGAYPSVCRGAIHRLTAPHTPSLGTPSQLTCRVQGQVRGGGMDRRRVGFETSGPGSCETISPSRQLQSQVRTGDSRYRPIPRSLIGRQEALLTYHTDYLHSLSLSTTISPPAPLAPSADLHAQVSASCRVGSEVLRLKVGNASPWTVYFRKCGRFPRHILGISGLLCS